MIRLGILVVCAATLLIACNGVLTSQVSTPTTREAALRDAAPSRYSGSWMAPDAKNDDLLYVTDAGEYFVAVYKYPQGTLVGSLQSAYGSPTGLCVDKSGDIFITEYDDDEVLEYAHGGSEPIASFTNLGYPFGCSIDPTTGTLAVADEMSPSQGYGYVSIFTNAQGNPTTYTDWPALGHPYWCSYDDHGNLFVDGEDQDDKYEVNLAELPKGSASLTNISVGFDMDYPPEGLQWDGQYETIGNALSIPVVIDRFKVSGSAASIVGSTTLGNWDRWFPTDFILRTGKKRRLHNVVIATDGTDIEFFPYPAGGSPTKSIPQNWPWSTAVSLAKK
jgi:YD repeat-containing protein